MRYDPVRMVREHAVQAGLFDQQLKGGPQV
jgi:hypothetical protein